MALAIKRDAESAVTNTDATDAEQLPSQKEDGQSPPEDVDVLMLPPNLAGNKKLVDKVLKIVQDDFQRFANQAARTTLKDKMKIADAMLRCSMRRKVTDATYQQRDTYSNVSSTSFYDSIRVTVAGQRAVMFYGDQLPFRYVQRPGTNDFPDVDTAERVAEAQNLAAIYVWDKGKYEKVNKEALYYNAKYGQEMLCMTWEREVEERTERVPFASPEDPNGRVIYAFDTRRRLVTDWPVLERCDLKDMWFDLQIDDMQKQKTIVRRKQVAYEEFVRKSAGSGEYTNLDKLTDAMKYTTENVTGNSEQLEDRQENAGEDKETQETGAYDTYYVWVRLPIDNPADPKKAKYTKKAHEQWYEMTYVGNLATGDGICIQFRANPYFHKKNPYNLIHSHMDDKGAIHMGYGTLLECLYEEETTTINQHIDNKTRIIDSPFIAEKGNVLEKKLMFGRNYLYFVKPGTGRTALTKMDIPDATKTTIPILDWIEKRFNRTAGTDKPIAGEAMGGRTTATEATSVINQAMKPALEDARYIADQLFPWEAEMIAELMRQFADPDLTWYIQRGNVPIPIKPAELYGEYDVRVVSIGQFESDIVRQQTENDFIARVLPLGIQAGVIGKEQLAMLLRDVAVSRKMPNANKYFNAQKNVDAERVAWSENDARFMGPDGTPDMPQEGEAHSTHLPIHESWLIRYKTIPAEQQDPQVISLAEAHIALTKQFIEQEKTNTTMIGSNQFGTPGQQESNPQMAGEVAGDALGGQMGGAVGAGMAGEAGPEAGMEATNV